MKTIYTFFCTTTFCLMAMLSFGQINSFDNPTIFNAPLTIIDGNEGMGKILSSNAAGLATWQDAALPGQWIKTGSNVLELANDSLNVLITHTNANSFSSAKFQINNSSTDGFNTAFRVQVDGSTKLALHNNGGLDIGAYSSTGIAPDNGLYVHGNIQLNADALVHGDVLLGDVGTASADGHRLSVDGKIACEEVLVALSGAWPDYVFKSDYELKSLDQVKEYIADNGHLPGVPSAKDVENSGIQVGLMNKILIEKVEELTLYVLQQEEQMKAQQLIIEMLVKHFDASENIK